MEWRRFELVNKSNEEKLLKLIELRKLSKEDLMLILETIKVRDGKETAPEVPAQEQPEIIDYGAVNLKKMIITTDKSFYEKYKNNSDIGLLFEPSILKIPGKSIFIFGIQQDK